MQIIWIKWTYFNKINLYVKNVYTESIGTGFITSRKSQEMFTFKIDWSRQKPLEHTLLSSSSIDIYHYHTLYRCTRWLYLSNYYFDRNRNKYNIFELQVLMSKFVFSSLNSYTHTIITNHNLMRIVGDYIFLKILFVFFFVKIDSK